eukprot:4959277-Prymnesium_polylepis.1
MGSQRHCLRRIPVLVCKVGRLALVVPPVVDAPAARARRDPSTPLGRWIPRGVNPTGCVSPTGGCESDRGVHPTGCVNPTGV